MNRFLFMLFLFGGVLPLSAQTMQQFIDDAEKQHANENYYGAYDSYRIAAEFDSTRMDLWYEQGENARLYTAYHTALTAYQRVRRFAAAGEFPELEFRLGEVNQSLGNYEEAVAHYRRYLDQDEAETAHRAAAAKNLADSQWAADRIEEADPFVASHLPRDINTEYSDFSFRRRGALSFLSSNRQKFENDSLVPVRYLSRIFQNRPGDTAVVEQPVPGVDPEAGRHTAHTAFNLDGSRVYYTLCEYVDGTESVRCELHFSAVGASGAWGPPVRLDINVAGANNTQPHVAPDPVTGEETLFFASDRPGGQGGLDLYRAVLNEDGTARAAVNVADVNTAGDEITPFLDSESCRLYFSTDGRQTLGGFDVYYAPVTEGSFGSPVHLNSPVNSSFHDRYYIISREDGKAYFSSNRQGEESIRWSAEESACCDDVYSVPFDETILLDVYTYRELDNTDLNRSTVALYRRGADAERELVETKTQADSNHFVFSILPGAAYELDATRPAFGPADTTVDLSIPCERPDSQRLRRNLFLPQLLIVRVFDEKTREPLNGARVQLATAAETLDTPLADEIGAETNHFEFRVSLEQSYFIHAERRMYAPRDTALTIPEAAVDAEGRYTLDIYLPQPDPIDLIPVNLYFDNDRPHARSLRTDSDIQYVETNLTYYDRKAAFIEDQVKPGMSEEEEFLTREQLNDFFENDVLGGREELIELAGALYERLQLGTRYTMTVQGAASARGNPVYNRYLSQRRVDSVLDFFREYDGGVLQEFIDSGALDFETEWIGDTQANKDDTSVYGLRASRDRRVTISDLKVSE
jgi:outer membrane protein OmpA-like peptidoglycan-associated protein